MDEEKISLSKEDVELLRSSGNDTATQADVVTKLAKQYTRSDFSSTQIKLAEEIFRLLLKEAAVEVREALAENIVGSTEIPRDIVLSLAKDVSSVSCPVLRFSEVLDDDDLIEIITTTEEISKQLAISERSAVSEKVSDALIETKKESIISTLLKNHGARISEKGYMNVTQQFPQSEAVMESLITRGTLSPKIIQKVTASISDALRRNIEMKYHSSLEQIHQFFQEGSEIAAIRFMGQQVIDEDLMETVDRLERSGKLEESLMPGTGELAQLLDGLDDIGDFTPLSVLARGHLTLFEISLSRLTHIPFSNIRKLMKNPEKGFQGLYEKAGLPLKMYDTVQTAIHVIQHMDEEARSGRTQMARHDLHGFIRRLIQASNERYIRNLPHFVSMVQHHIEKSTSEW